MIVNVEGVSADAPLTVQLLDENAKPVEGAVAKVTESGTRVAVSLANPILAGKSYALRVELPDAGDVKIYSVYVTDE